MVFVATNGREPTAGRHDFNGDCAPKVGRASYGQITFSVGVFEWLPKSRGKGLKRGKAKVRLYGPYGRPELVYAEAQRCCDVLDAGGELGFKTKWVR